MDRNFEEKLRALGELEHLRGLAQQLGNDDHESRAIADLISGVKEGKIDVSHAIAQARGLIDSKNR